MDDPLRTAAAYRIRARNTAADSTNKIHDDEVARTYGFAGGLVPGVTDYAYLSHVPAAAWGRPWLERGTLEVRFRQPVYDGEDIEVVPGPFERDADGEAFDLELRGPAGRVCAKGRATLPDRAPVPPSPESYPRAPLPDTPPAASADVLSAIGILGSVELSFDPQRADRYLDSIGESLDLYRGDGLGHPGWLLQWANWILVANVALGPWVHTASAAQHFSVLDSPASLSVRGRVAGLYERRGNKMVDLDLLIVAEGGVAEAGVAGPAVPVAQLRHSAIYELQASGGASP